MAIGKKAEQLTRFGLEEVPAQLALRKPSALYRSPAFILCAIFMVIMALFGGASRDDAQSQLVVRFFAIAAGAWALYGMNVQDLNRVKVPLIWLGSMATLMLLQLVPLPPGVWAELSGRGRFLSLLELAEVADRWRPLSLTPDLTINALLATMPAFAALLLFSRLPARGTRLLLYVLAAICAVSGLIGLLQATPAGRDLYFYHVTNQGSAVGLFANRNHQGFLLALVLPVLGVLARWIGRSPGHEPRLWLCLGCATLIVPLVIITGSRGALALVLVGAISGWLLFSSGRSKVAVPSTRKMWFALIGLAVMGLGLVLAAAISARGFAVQRLFEEDVSQEVRVVLFQPMLKIALTYMPWGSGFGSFNDIFRVDEPLSNLSGSYLNHAHNDLLELAIEGGVPALAILMGFLFWFVRASVAAWQRDASDERVVFARLGSTIIGMLLLGSLADYPLRTPSMMIVFALAAVWLCAIRRPSHNQLYRSGIRD